MSEGRLGEALRLAAKGRFTASPNPLVGCVVVDSTGAVVGRGYHRRPGEPHAEIHALREAGERAVGGTVYVTLEPCSHHGRTPPCVETIIGHRPAKVVACHADPHARVAGTGFAALAEAGIAVEVGALSRRALALNLPFIVSHLLGRPAVTVKWAMSADGKIATAAGESQWISSPQGRRWALQLREEHDAILVGSGTALADDPSLNRRLGKADGEILRVVLDRRLRLPETSKMLSLEGAVLVYTQSREAGRIARLERAGATVEALPAFGLGAVLEDLATRGVQSVLVEGGGEVASSFVAAGLFDRVDVCYSPMMIGGREAPGPLGGEGAAKLSVAPRLEDRTVRRRGPDLVIAGYRAGLLGELERRLPGAPSPGSVE